MPTLDQPLFLPDGWQHEAVRALLDGCDVIVDAPTGAGKTFVFEMAFEQGQLKGQAVFTVPTRALANDKCREWRRRGWRVGITTGDLVDDPAAPVVVATLETQMGRLLRGEGPGLLVVDEYQMIADPGRGLHYEIALAATPPATQVLLLSGSVANPGDVAAWLRRLGRRPHLVRHRDRPVPLDEVSLEALPERGLPPEARDPWPNLLGRALRQDLGPILAFAPRRRAAEALARQLAAQLPAEDQLVLTPTQARLAGDELGRLLRQRIAYHHSGLSYRQRAGLVEPLAKAGQLRIVVATTGLAAGINFSLRSVVVTDREYRAGDESRLLRPDELLQMYGRAGRRGLDTRGYLLVIPGKPRLSEGRPRALRRPDALEWPSLLGVMRMAVERGDDPVSTARQLVGRLFTTHALDLGPLPEPEPAAQAAESQPQRPADGATRSVVEIQGLRGAWERRRPRQRRPFAEALFFDGSAWVPAPTHAAALVAVPGGSPCRIEADGEPARYGREFPLARYGDPAKGETEVVPTKWLRRLLERGRRPRIPRRPTLHWLEHRLLPALPDLLDGALPVRLVERGGQFRVQVDPGPCLVPVWIDQEQNPLLNPPTRERAEKAVSFAELMGGGAAAASGTQRSERGLLRTWHRLGLIEANGYPTLRGCVFSCFQGGEGLAVAAALEDESYPIGELLFDLANLRGGHRFGHLESVSNRLGARCREVFGLMRCEPYLRHGLPPTFGEGAAEALRALAIDPAALRRWGVADLGRGDVERARLEWRSLLRQLASAPTLPWQRWMDLRRGAAQLLEGQPPESVFDLDG